MPSGVLDANEVIGLSKGGVFQHLAALYAPLYVPADVRREVIEEGHGRPGAAELAGALGAWIVEVTPDPATVAAFAALPSLGDREVIAVAVANSVDHVLSEDLAVAREARLLCLTCLASAQVVVVMKSQGCIPAVKSVLNRMR